jgi:hypothetical protein
MGSESSESSCGTSTTSVVALGNRCVPFLRFLHNVLHLGADLAGAFRRMWHCLRCQRYLADVRQGAAAA